jgi:hypothetical protein
MRSKSPPLPDLCHAPRIVWPFVSHLINLGHAMRFIVTPCTYRAAVLKLKVYGLAREMHLKPKQREKAMVG